MISSVDDGWDAGDVDCLSSCVRLVESSIISSNSKYLSIYSVSCHVPSSIVFALPSYHRDLSLHRRRRGRISPPTCKPESSARPSTENVSEYHARSPFSRFQFSVDGKVALLDSLRA